MKTARRGGPLIQATRPFAKEDPSRTWKLFASTIAVAVAGVAVASWPGAGPVRWMASVLLGLVAVRIFIFYHDCLHGAIWRRSKAGHGLMAAFGMYVLTAPSVWKQTHNYHHAHNAKMVGSGIGSFPTLTLRMYRALTPLQRVAYRASRHWLTILFGYFTVFFIGMAIRPLLRNPKKHWDAGLALVIHCLLWVILIQTGGLELALLLVGIPCFVACGLGSYLFYAQHNYTQMQLRDRSEWNYTDAALDSSSMMEMSPLMHWFTGNIGYHHVHHLNPAIPFYRLEEAMNEVPELQNPGKTSLHPSEVAGCVRLLLWDAQERRMLTVDEVEEALRATAARAAG